MSDLLITYLPYFLMCTFSLVPIAVLYLLYRRTNVFDYLIFAGVFLFFSSSVAFSILATISTSSLIYWQLRHIAMDFCYILIFLHAIRIAWAKYPKFLTWFIVAWFILLVILTLFWKPMPNERGVVLLWETDPHSMDSIFNLRNERSDIPEIGAGLTMNGVIILSTSHPLLAYGFYFLVACTFLYVYLTQKPASPTTRIIKAKRLWILTGMVNFSATGLLLFWPFSLTYELVIIFVIAELVLIAFVALKYPESMLLSHVQLHRAFDLYKKVKTMEKTDYRRISEIRMEKVVEYLQRIDMVAIEKEISELR